MARQAADDLTEDDPERRTDMADGPGRTDSAAGPVTVGERLRATRDALGIELRDVSETLRIRYDHLLAIEEHRYAELPAPVYAIGFSPLVMMMAFLRSTTISSPPG